MTEVQSSVQGTIICLFFLPVPMYVQCTQIYFHYSRCCEYALLVLEYWADAPEIQRSADLYEDMIKCCVADAMSEVGSGFWPFFSSNIGFWPLLHTVALSFLFALKRVICVTNYPMFN